MTLSPEQDPPVDDIIVQARSMTSQQLDDSIHSFRNEMRETIADLLDDEDKLFHNLFSARNNIGSHQSMGTLKHSRHLLLVNKELNDAEITNYRYARDLYMKSTYRKLDALYDELQRRAYSPLMALPPATMASSTVPPHAGEEREIGPVVPGSQVTWSHPNASSFMAPSSGKVNDLNFSLDMKHTTWSLSSAGAEEGTLALSQSILTEIAKHTTNSLTTNDNMMNAPKTSGQGSGSVPESPSSITSNVASSEFRSAKEIRATPSEPGVIARPKKKNPGPPVVTRRKPSTGRTESFLRVWSELQREATEYRSQTTLIEPSFKSLTMETFGKYGQMMPTFRPLKTTKNVVFSTKKEVLRWRWLRPVEDETEVLFFSNSPRLPKNLKPSDFITRYNVARQRKEAVYFEIMAIVTLLLNRDEAKRLRLVFFAEKNSLQSLLNPLMHSRQHLVRMAWCTEDYEVYTICGLDPMKRW